jgi:hypothetical protein
MSYGKSPTVICSSAHSEIRVSKASLDGSRGFFLKRRVSNISRQRMSSVFTLFNEPIVIPRADTMLELTHLIQRTWVGWMGLLIYGHSHISTCFRYTPVASLKWFSARLLNSFSFLETKSWWWRKYFLWTGYLFIWRLLLIVSSVALVHRWKGIPCWPIWSV